MEQKERRMKGTDKRRAFRYAGFAVLVALYIVSAIFIPRSAEGISYIGGPAGDIPNVQVDGRVNGKDYREYAVVRLDGENWESEENAQNRVIANREDDQNGI